jgi:hypothetical protein
VQTENFLDQKVQGAIFEGEISATPIGLAGTEKNLGRESSVTPTGLSILFVTRETSLFFPRIGNIHLGR